MLPFADKLYGDADLIFQQDLAPAHIAKGIDFNDQSVTELHYPENESDQKPMGYT